LGGKNQACNQQHPTSARGSIACKSSNKQQQTSTMRNKGSFENREFLETNEGILGIDEEHGGEYKGEPSTQPFP